MNLLTFDLNLLRVFDVVMTEQNTTRAADRLATTQPAVSNALKRLRDAVGDELFVRTARGVRPTARAEALWPAIRQALALINASLAAERFDIADSTATFRIAMADATASLLLPPLMAAIKREAPQVNMRLVALTSRDPRGALVRGDIDLAIGFFPGVAAQIAGDQSGDTAISLQSLYTSEYVCVMRRDHALAGRVLDVDAYCAAEHALVSFSGKPHGPADEALEQLGRRRRVALTVNQFYTLFRVVSRSDLLAIVPRHLIEANGMREHVVVKPPPFPLPAVEVDMVWHERSTNDPAHAWLRSTLAGISVRDTVDA